MTTGATAISSDTSRPGSFLRNPRGAAGGSSGPFSRPFSRPLRLVAIGPGPGGCKLGGGRGCKIIGRLCPPFKAVKQKVGGRDPNLAVRLDAAGTVFRAQNALDLRTQRLDQLLGGAAQLVVAGEIEQSVAADFAGNVLGAVVIGLKGDARRLGIHRSNDNAEQHRKPTRGLISPNQRAQLELR